MKIEYIIKSMVAASLLFAACTKESPTPSSHPLPPQGMAEVSLGDIRLSDATTLAHNSSSRAATNNLAENTTLRLYALKTGETDLYKCIASRTYTIDDTGAPVLDAGQSPLYLPVGDVDIYLAGPVEHNIGTAEAPVWEHVAGFDIITPRQGVDLIAGYTAATIGVGNTNALPDVILTHKMAKVQVVVSRPVAAAYEKLRVKEIKIFDQSQNGTYTLDANGGAIIPGATSNFIYPQIVEEIPQEKYSGTVLLIPQPEKKLKIETTFECNQINTEVGDNHPTIRYRQSGLITTELGGGTATRFTASPLTPIEIKWRVSSLPWDMVIQDDVIIPGLDDSSVIINGLIWTKGNLVATSSHECEIGAPADCGVYFLFGSLVGWTGGKSGSGVGKGTPSLDKQVWPKEMGEAKPTFGYSGNQGVDISTLTYFFNYSIAPWNVQNPSSNIGTFDVSITGDTGSGTLRDGRYAALGVGDPCTYYLGAEYRLPTQVELQALKDSGYSDWGETDGINGRWFGPQAGHIRSSIFLPAAGHRYAGSGNFWQLNAEARYGTCSVVSATNYYYMYVNSTKVNSPDNAGRNTGLPARCVREL